MLWKSIGMLAAILTMFGFVPQIVKMSKTKSSQDISIIMLLQFFLGVTLWVLYGIYLRDAIIICANAVTLITLAIAIALYFKCRTRNTQPVTRNP